MTHKYFDFTFEYEGNLYYSSTTHNGTIYANDYTLTLTGSNITVGQSLSLSGTFSGGSDYDIKIYQDNTLIDTVITGTNGAFSKTVTGLSGGSYTFKAVFESSITSYILNSSNLNIIVNKITPTISLSTSTSSITYGENATVTGTLSVGSGKSVKIYDSDTLLDTVTTTTNGVFSYSTNTLSGGNHTLKATFDGDDTYNSVTSDNVSITINKLTPTITISINPTTTTFDNQYTTVSGTLSAGSGKTIKIYTGGTTLLGTVTTGVDGAFSKTVYGSFNLNYNSITAKFDGDSGYNSVTSKSVYLKVNKEISTLSCEVDNTTITYGESVTVSGRLNPGGNWSIKIYQNNSLIDTVNINGAGAYSKTITGLEVGNYTFKASWDGSYYYNSVTSSSVSVTVIA